MTLVSLDHLTLIELTPPQLVAAAAEAGYTHVGMRLNPAAPPEEKQHPMLGDSPMRRETQARMRDTGVALFDFAVLRLKRDTDVAAFEPVLETGATLGARRAVVNGDEHELAPLAERFAELCELGRRFGIAMNLEFTPWTGVPTLARALEVIATSGHPDARLMVDTIHVDRSGATPADLARIPARLVDYVQVCDASGPRPTDFPTMIYQARNERGFPGEGNLDLVAMLAALPPDVPLSLEAPVRSLAATLTPVERARRGRLAVTALLDRLARHRADG